MSLFNWFSGKSGQHKTDGTEDSDSSLRDAHTRPGSREKTPLPASQRVVADPGNRSEDRKVKRHARREQLYIAVREAMTRCGVLSSSYKFKVLSLDQRGDQFLVMMDLDPSFAAEVDRMSEVEAKITQTARARFEILVTSVYWRIDPQAAISQPVPLEQQKEQDSTDPLSAGARPAAPKKSALRYEPIQADEVAAFKQALAAASGGQASATEKNVKVKSGARSYTLLTGFEDTEMPESAAIPVLSSTQYGDLN